MFSAYAIRRNRLFLIALFGLVIASLLLVLTNAHGGHSKQYRKQDHTGHYKFAYHIHDPWGKLHN